MIPFIFSSGKNNIFRTNAAQLVNKIQIFPEQTVLVTTYNY